jgi:hypothetical protein
LFKCIDGMETPLVGRLDHMAHFKAAVGSSTRALAHGKSIRDYAA